MYSYIPRGVCSREIHMDVEDGVIKHVDFVGGCPGNLAAISKLVQGRPVDEVIDLLDGLKCGTKSTSCSDQMVQGLKAVREAQAQA